MMMIMEDGSVFSPLCGLAKWLFSMMECEVEAEDLRGENTTLHVAIACQCSLVHSRNDCALADTR